MTRSEVVRFIALKTSLTQKQAREAVDAYSAAIAMAANEGEDTTIAGFGKFLTRNRPEAVRRNPRTGEQITVPARKTVTFRASQAFRSKLD